MECLVPVFQGVVTGTPSMGAMAIVLGSTSNNRPELLSSQSSDQSNGECQWSTHADCLSRTDRVSFVFQVRRILLCCDTQRVSECGTVREWMDDKYYGGWF